MPTKPGVAIRIGLMLVSAGAGCLDVLSYRYLGEVFPSAMTGNLALLGRSLGEVDGQAALRNLCAFAGFFGGVLAGAALLRGTPGRLRGALPSLLQTAVLGAVVWFWDRHALGSLRFGLIGAASVGMGLQSAVAHRIGVHAVATTYFTGTTANIAFGLVTQAVPRPPFRQRVGWPVFALIFYLAGAALAGWSIVGHGFPALPIGLEALPGAAAAILGIVVSLQHRGA